MKTAHVRNDIIYYWVACKCLVFEIPRERRLRIIPRPHEFKVLCRTGGVGYITPSTFKEMRECREILDGGFDPVFGEWDKVTWEEDGDYDPEYRGDWKEMSVKEESETLHVEGKIIDSWTFDRCLVHEVPQKRKQKVFRRPHEFKVVSNDGRTGYITSLSFGEAVRFRQALNAGHDPVAENWDDIDWEDE